MTKFFKFLIHFCFQRRKSNELKMDFYLQTAIRQTSCLLNLNRTKWVQFSVVNIQLRLLQIALNGIQYTSMEFNIFY